MPSFTTFFWEENIPTESQQVIITSSSPAKKGIETMVFQCHFSVLVTDFEQVKAHWGTTSVHSVHNHSLFFQKCGWCFITVGWLHLHALYMWHYINISASPNTKISTFWMCVSLYLQSLAIFCKIFRMKYNWTYQYSKTL